MVLALIVIDKDLRRRLGGGEGLLRELLADLLYHDLI
jgi:hypothetical protein